MFKHENRQQNAIVDGLRSTNLANTSRKTEAYCHHARRPSSRFLERVVRTTITRTN